MQIYKLALYFSGDCCCFSYGTTAKGYSKLPKFTEMFKMFAIPFA